MPIYKTDKKNKDGVVQYRVFVSYTTSGGEHKKASKRVYGLAEAKRAEADMLTNLNEHESAKPLTVSELFEKYIAYKKYQVRATSLDKSIMNITRHVLPYIGDIRTNRLNVRNLTEWKQNIEESQLSLVSKQNVYTELRTMLNYAVKMEYIQSSPLSKVGNFKDSYAQKKEIVYYTPEQFEAYASVCYRSASKIDFYDFYVFFCLLYYSGARKGEIHALRWCDIEGNIIHITKSLAQKLKGEDIITPPKNKSSIRDVQLPSVMVKILKEHHDRCAQLYDDFNDEFYICGGKRPLRDTTIQKKNEEIAKEAGLHRIRIHDFRHSHASLLINNNINVLEVSRRLGHSNIEMTLNTYSHFFPKEEDKALAILDSIKCK